MANNKIRLALYQQVLEHDNIQLITGHSVESVVASKSLTRIEIKSKQDDQCISLHASLLVAADSRFSQVRRMMGISAKMKDYGRVMIVCNMEHELDHQHIAQECFQYGKTCAILPLGKRQSSIVITTPASLSHQIMAMNDDKFAQYVEEILSNRLGKMKLISAKFPYPLVGTYSQKFIGERFVLIGDAAVGMHPVTAHGYNLGLRSADTLASEIIKAHQNGKDIASSWLLNSYQMRHRLLSRPVYEATNAIVQIYTDDRIITKAARKLAIHGANRFLPFKKMVTHKLIDQG